MLAKVKERPLPRHIAIITDGNGRWARERGLPRLAGHREGTNAVKRIVEAAAEIGVECVTFYAFSTENWSRPIDEVGGLMRIIEDRLAREISELHSKGVRIRTIGRMGDLPASTAQAFSEAERRTAGNTRLTMVIALSYGGRAEIVDAARSLASSVSAGSLKEEEIDERAFADRLYTADLPDPELLVRTSGELRVSNFLLWQIAYSEIWVTPVLWPDFKKVDLLEAIHDFQNRKRRFGGIEKD
ncbi:MAG: isoprenyl transferase [Candidatus Aquicultorales bacterium]